VAAHASDAGDDPVGRRVGFLVAGEQPVLLQRGTGIQQQLEPVADEELALGAELVAVPRVALLDARAFLEVAFLTLAHGGLL
jgi:hypothetical protein